MKLRGHGNGVAIAIAALALVVAGTGAAVAATSTTTIRDATVPANVARVDGSGRLNTIGVASSISSTGYFDNAGVVNMTSATAASLAITQLALSETAQNANIAGSDLTVRLVQNSVDANGNCTVNAIRYISLTALSAGDHVDLAANVPFVIKAVNKAKYCLGLYSVVTNGATDVTNYYPYFTFGAYVASGSYTGIGASASPVTALPAKKSH